MLRRVVTEHRRFLIVLAVALAVNVGVYAAVVYPLGLRVADASRRADQADQARRAAQREFAAAQAVATGKQRAEAELRTFYGQVLPSDASAATRATYLSLAQLAAKANLRITRRLANTGHVHDSSLDQLKLSIVLEGSYEDMRRFIYQLETMPTFIVIEEMAIDQGREQGKPLVMTLDLSTFFRTAAHAS